MDPNNNQPGSPSPTAGQEQPTTPSSSSAPDWQQDGDKVAPPAPTTGVVTPSQPPAAPSPATVNTPAVSPITTLPQSGETPVPGESGMPPTSTASTGLPPKKKLSRMLIIVAVVVLVLALAAASYFLFLKKDPNTNTNSNDAAKQSTATTTASDMSKLAHVTLNLSAAPAGYTARSTGVDTIKDYISSDGNCEFIIGTVPVAQLPGADLNAIVEPQIQGLKKDGATVKGPSAGSALALKEQGGSKTYAMPTLNFEFSQDIRHATVHYSAVILSSTDRAVINRTCANKDGAVDTTKLEALDTIAKSVTVTVKQ